MNRSSPTPNYAPKALSVEGPQWPNAGSSWLNEPNVDFTPCHRPMFNAFGHDKHLAGVKCDRAIPRDGIGHWLHGSIAEDVSHKAKVATLFISPTARGFVDQDTGKVSLSRVLLPVDYSPPINALRDIRAFVQSVGGSDAILEFMHVGETEPQIIEDGAVVPVTLQTGDLVSAILATAERADLIAMPTKGRDGFLDVLRGSTTERVGRHAPCPVLALPVN